MAGEPKGFTSARFAPAVVGLRRFSVRARRPTSAGVALAGEHALGGSSRASASRQGHDVKLVEPESRIVPLPTKTRGRTAEAGARLDHQGEVGA